jgi:hypothetical protein
MFENANKITHHIPHGARGLDIVRVRGGSKSTQIRRNKVIIILICGVFIR